MRPKKSAKPAPKATPEPILRELYARVDILDIVSSGSSSGSITFQRTGSLYLLGAAAKHVKSASDISVRNKPLEAAIGANAIAELTSEPYSVVGGGSVVGGDDDDWDELDDIEVEDLLNTEHIPVAVSSTLMDKTVSGNHISGLSLYSKDKMSDVTEKIGLITKLKPYKQYLWLPEANQSLLGDEMSLMNHWLTAIHTVEGYPVDIRAASAASGIQSSVGQFASGSAVILTCISLDSVVRDKSRLQMIWRSDVESFDVIYSNLIERFFPAISQSMFMQYLTNEKEMDSKFAQTIFDRKDIRKRHEHFAKLLPELSKQQQVTVDSSEVSISTTGMILSMRYPDRMVRINTMKLFESIDVTRMSDVAMVDMYRYDNEHRPVRLRKIPQRDQYRLVKDDQTYFGGFYSRRNLVWLRTMVITVLPRKEYDAVMIVLDQFGTIWMKLQPNSLYTFSKTAFLGHIAPIINPILETLNAIDVAFATAERLPYLAANPHTYEILSSSSKLVFKFQISYEKLLGVFAREFIAAGLIAPFQLDWHKRRRVMTFFEIRYGVARMFESKYKNKMIELRDLGGIALVSLTNLDVEETVLYVDLIGRLAEAYKSELQLAANAQQQLAVVDPILYRPRLSSDAYSRICQKRFQPIVSTKDDPKAVKYHNFTFDRPEYYKCPHKSMPILGFIPNKHDKGYCLPCCRKTEQQESTKRACLAMTDPSNDAGDEESSSTTYKIEYPIHEVPNTRIMNRRVSIPAYVTELLEVSNVVANGTILASHTVIHDGMNPAAKSFLQTAFLVASIASMRSTPRYKSHREFIIDLIAMIKQPHMQVRVMKNRMVSDRFTTPQGLIQAIEDQFLKMSVLSIETRLSSMEWNDLIVYLANCMGHNVLLLADDRLPQTNIQLMNLDDVDETRPVVIFLRRLNLEWSVLNHDTRALYMPITVSMFKVQQRVPLYLYPIDVSKALTKIKRAMSGSALSVARRQLTIDHIRAMCDKSRSYKLVGDLSEQKAVVIDIGRSRMVSTIATLTISTQASALGVSPTAPMKDVLTFISDYNEHFVDEMPNVKAALENYKTYLRAALKMSKPYEYIATAALLLKVHRVITHKAMAIGVVVQLIDVKQVLCTELMFFKPTPLKSATNEINRQAKLLEALESRANAKAILCHPMAAAVSFIDWELNPLTTAADSSSRCKSDMLKAFNAGSYTNEIYTLFAFEVLEMWKRDRDDALDAAIIANLRKAMKTLPITRTKIDTLILELTERFTEYDPLVIRSTITDLFDRINASDKSLKDAVARITQFEELSGFSLRNVYRMNRKAIAVKVESFAREVTVKTTTYPSFNIDAEIADQRDLFYKPRVHKLMVHTSIYADLVNMLVSDLMNPFRRDFVIKAPLADALLSDIHLHMGELVYIQYLRKQ